MLKDFLSVDDLKREELFELLELSAKLKKSPINGLFKNKVFCLYFEKPSTRTRMSFDIGIKQLGGDTFFLDTVTSQLSRGETIEDTIRVMERYVNAGIAARVYSHDTLLLMSKLTGLHVINALSNLEHPCQVLADIFTIKEKFGDFKDLKLAFVGDGNNVCNSLLIGCSKVGMNMTVGCPKNHQPNGKILEMAQNYAKITKVNIEVTDSPKKAVKDANIVYTDVFVSMGEGEEKMKVFLPDYQVNSKLMDLASKDALFMHCLPAHRGQEVTSDVLDGYRSIVYDQAENRLHTQKALIIMLFKMERWINLNK